MEFAAAFADGDHAVGDQAVIKDRVALVQNVDVAADLNLQRALDDDVEFLTVVRVERDGRVLFFGEVGELDEEGLGKLILELRGEVIVDDALFLDDFQAFALAGDGKRGQRGAGTFEQVDNLVAAGFRSFIDKGKAEVGLAGFELQIILGRNARQVGEFFRRIPCRFAQIFDSACDIFQIVVHVVLLLSAFWLRDGSGWKSGFE